MSFDDSFTRRQVLAAGGVAATLPALTHAHALLPEAGSPTVPATLRVNGKAQAMQLEPRATLLDTLRERLQLFGTKKGCDIGQCGACTVHIDGKRVLSCLTLAVQVSGRQITTIEGIAPSDTELHPMQQAFLDNDALQCGYCTPGQIMSGIACVREGHAGSEDDIREYMSGNLCRCGAYRGIVAAIAQISGEKG